MRVNLFYPDGESAGTFETTARDFWVGDVFTTGDGRKLRIVSQIPIARMEEFHDKPRYAIWGVEPVEAL